MQDIIQGPTVKVLPQVTPVPGCVMEGVQLLGGDLDVIKRGGGLKANRVRDCYERCKEQLSCRWYTFDQKVEYYFLKEIKVYYRVSCGSSRCDMTYY